MRKSLRLGCVGHYSRRASNMSGEAIAWRIFSLLDRTRAQSAMSHFVVSVCCCTP